jgi:hypothetical protein
MLCFVCNIRLRLVRPGVLGEVFVTLHGEPYLLWPAVDQHGAELDILLLKLRDKAAAKRCLKRVLAACPEAQRRIATSLSLVMSGGATALPTRDARCGMYARQDNLAYCVLNQQIRLTILRIADNRPLAEYFHNLNARLRQVR